MERVQWASASTYVTFSNLHFYSSHHFWLPITHNTGPNSEGEEARVTVTANSANSITFTGRIKLKPGAEVKVPHGYGYLGRHATFTP